jgi:hypothetical protein
LEEGTVSTTQSSCEETSHSKRIVSPSWKHVFDNGISLEWKVNSCSSQSQLAVFIHDNYKLYFNTTTLNQQESVFSRSGLILNKIVLYFIFSFAKHLYTSFLGVVSTLIRVIVISVVCIAISIAYSELMSAIHFPDPL